MSSLKYSEKTLLEKILDMKRGYVSDFSDRTIQEFVVEMTGIDIFQKKYEEKGTSKANRIRAFWEKESDEVVADLVEAFLKHAEFEKTQHDKYLTVAEEHLFSDARKIVQRLRDEPETKVLLSAQKPAFIEIGQQGAVDSLVLEGNRVVGNADFLRNKGTLRSAIMKDNHHIVPDVTMTKGRNKDILTVHGDYVAGDKIGRDKNHAPEVNWLSKYWWGLLIPLIVVVLGYAITEGRLPQVFNLVDPQKISTLATSTPNLGTILLKNNTLATSVEKQTWIENYSDSTVYGSGTFSDITKNSQGYIVFMTLVNNQVGCQFALESGKELLLFKKGQNVNFTGTFTGSGLGGYGTVNPWYVTNCFLIR